MLGNLTTKLLLVGALAALVAWSRGLEDADAARRIASLGVEPLVTPEQRAEMRVAAVSVKRGDQEWLYARTRGVWRCLSLWGAEASAADLQTLVDTTLQASSVVQSDRPERFADYGIGTDTSYTVGFHGGGVLKREDRDLFFSIELGRVLTSLGGDFARLPGEDLVRVLDVDPRAALEPGGLPLQGAPLLDLHVVPERWPAPGRRIERLVIERVDGVAYELALRDRELTDEQRMAGESPVEWIMRLPDGSERAPSVDHTIAYTVFLRLATFLGLDDPEQAAALGLTRDTLIGRVGMAADDGETVDLLFGPQLPDGRVPVLTSLSQPVVFLAPDVAQLFLPTSGELLDATETNPWEPWLVEASRRALDAQTSRTPR